MSRFMSYLKEENGASAAEYALILGLIGVVIAAALTVLQTSITGAITAAATAI